MVRIARLPLEVPLDPDPPEAAEWLIEELAKPVYQAARPTLIDRIAEAIGDWLSSLQFGSVTGPPALGLGLVVVLVGAALVVAFLIFGMPRLNRRSGIAGALFGSDDDRSAARIRQDADAAARRGDFGTAIAEMFRSIARGLAERTIVTTSPGTTARDFAAHAGRAFPQFAQRLGGSAVAFDDVRYLGRVGTEEQYRAIAALESDLRTARANLEPATP